VPTASNEAHRRSADSLQHDGSAGTLSVKSAQQSERKTSKSGRMPRQRTCNQKVCHGDRMQDGTEAVVTLRRQAHSSKCREQPEARERRTLTIGAQGRGMFDQSGGGISGGTCAKHKQQRCPQHDSAFLPKVTHHVSDSRSHGLNESLTPHCCKGDGHTAEQQLYEPCPFAALACGALRQPLVQDCSQKRPIATQQQQSLEPLAG
jgi:hypothetical protein